jgi:hypothetical protein
MVPSVTLRQRPISLLESPCATKRAISLSLAVSKRILVLASLDFADRASARTSLYRDRYP